MLQCPFTISENSKIFFLQNPYNAVENNVTQHNAGTEIKEHNEHVKCLVVPTNIVILLGE